MSYVTVEEANAIVALNFLSSDGNRARWEALSDDDKTVLLHRAFTRIESLPFTGRKAVCTQANAFPRNRETAVSDTVKLAQVNEAMLDTVITGVKDVRSRGVKSFSIGHVSETYGGSETPGDPLIAVDVTTRRLLRNYLTGGFHVC